MTTLEEAKQHLRENWQEGTSCPACHQFVKLYVRPMHAAMAKTLIDLYKLGPGYHHALSFMTTGGDFAKLRFWDFIEEQENTGDNRTSGMWRITERGQYFVKGQLAVPAKVRLFNKQFFGFEGDPVTITKVLGNKFNYQELMGDKGQWL